MAELVVDTGAILHNYRRFAEGGKVIPVLKGNGYGLGVGPIQVLLKSWGVQLIGCSTPDEALFLARSGDTEVLLLTCVHNQQVLPLLLQKNIILAVESLEQAKLIDQFGIPTRVHLAVDTGLGRFGFRSSETSEMKAVFDLPNVQVCGIFSHFRGKADAASGYAVFCRVLDALQGYDVGLRHIAATSTALDERYRLDAVRIGTGLTGRCPGLQPAARLTAPVCSIHHLEKGMQIGYDGCRVYKDTDIAIVEIGTADGAFVDRFSGLRGYLRTRNRCAYLDGREAQVLGSPGLTHTIIDVTDLRCQVGDLVTVEQTPVLVSPAVPRRYL